MPRRSQTSSTRSSSASRPDGHTSVLSQSTCSTRAALAYLIRGELPADGTVCTDR
ncbi:alpha/beta hydrolase [Microbacterium resistens]|uniref:Alpha/beta hydrolase n=1 Tax=Microbacterium resistens TaxID=156977 RepID=A0ABY3RVS1_9MICO|nr:alpha/beta hydrolase [Microbacterium resistens]